MRPDDASALIARAEAAERELHRVLEREIELVERTSRELSEANDRAEKAEGDLMDLTAAVTIYIDAHDKLRALVHRTTRRGA